MARFVHWPSCQQVQDHVLNVAPGSTTSITSVAVAECGTDLYVRLVTASGQSAAGSANLNEDKRYGSVVPMTLTNVRNGDQVKVLHKVTNSPWSTPLVINVRAGAAPDSSKAAIRKSIVDLARTFVAEAHYLWGTAGNIPDQANGNAGGGKAAAAKLRAYSLDVRETKQDKVLGVCMAVQPRFDGYNTCAGRSSRFGAALDLEAYITARDAEIAAGRTDQTTWPGAPPRNLHPRKYHFRGTLKSGVVWGESCVGVRHFDCVGLVNYCYARHWYQPGFGMDIAAFREPKSGTVQVTNPNDRMDADILIVPPQKHIGMLYSNGNKWFVVQATDSIYGLSDNAEFDPSNWDRFRMNGAYLREMH